MDFLNKAYQSLVDLMRSLTPAARVSSVLMLLAIISSLFYLFQYQLNGGMVFVFGGQEFSQSEIGQMETAFAKAGLNNYTLAGNRIKIPLSSRDQYTKALADNDAVPGSILRREDAAVSSNPFMGSAAQKQMVKSQKTNKIREMILFHPMISNATVEYDERLEGAPFKEWRLTCAVVVSPKGSYHLTQDDIMAIQRTVRASLAGIKDGDITIFDSNAGMSYTGDMLTLGAEESLMIREKKRYEDGYRRKIQEQLVAYHGVTVGVEVELDPTLGTQTYQRTLDSPTTLQQNSERSTVRGQSGSGGAPGTRSNLPATANGAASVAEGRQSSTDSSKESSLAVAGGAIQHIQQAGLTVRRARVSVGVPQRTVEKLFYNANPLGEAAAGAIDPNRLNEFFETRVRQPISEKVRTLIKSVADNSQDPYDDIVVHMDPSLEMEALPTTPTSQTALSWLAANWQNLGLIGFGLVSLVMLRSMVSNAAKLEEAAHRADAELNRLLPPEEGSDEIEEVVVARDGSTRITKRKKSEESEVEREARENNLKKRFNNRQPTLREELAELVDADLDAAATVLKSWIGEPA